SQWGGGRTEVTAGAEVGLNEETAANRAVAIVENDGVRDEDLHVGLTLHNDAGCKTRTRSLKISYHAVLNMHGVGRGHEYSVTPGDLPVEDQSAQADGVARARRDVDGNAPCRRQNARLAGPVISDIHRLADGQLQTEIKRGQYADISARHDVVDGLLQAQARRRDGAARGAVHTKAGNPDLSRLGIGRRALQERQQSTK